MVHREINIDEETDRILTDLAAEAPGDFSQVITDLAHAHKGLEQFVEHCEQESRDELIAQRERAERGFSSGKFTEWTDVKQRNGL